MTLRLVATNSRAPSLRGINVAATIIDCNRPPYSVTGCVLWERAMRLKFWQSEKASVPPAQPAAAPTAQAAPTRSAPLRSSRQPQSLQVRLQSAQCLGDLDLAPSGTRCCARRRGSSSRPRSSLRCRSPSSTSSRRAIKSEARILVDGRENVFLRPNARARRGAQGAGCRSDHQPGADRAVARSGARDHPQEQAERAARVRSGPAGPVAVAARCWRCSASAAIRSRSARKSACSTPTMSA